MNSFTFATSFLLALAVIFPSQVLRLLGDMQPFLMFTAIVGFLYPTFRTVVAHDFVRGGGVGGLLTWTVDGGRY